jgi:hypothetical protein
MKKVIRLTESDLVRLVKRVVKESEENNSVEVAQEVVSQLSDDQISQLKKQINRMGPERFLSKFESAVGCLSQHSINEDEESDIENKLQSAEQYCGIGVMVTLAGLTMVALGQDYSTGNQIADVGMAIFSLLMSAGGPGLFIKGLRMHKKYGPEKERINREKDREWRNKRGLK